MPPGIPTPRGGVRIGGLDLLQPALTHVIGGSAWARLPSLRHGLGREDADRSGEGKR
jgi:hypothetical protein